MRPAEVSRALQALRGLTLNSLRPYPQVRTVEKRQPRMLDSLHRTPHASRPFCTSGLRMGTWLEPSIDQSKKKAKGRPRVPTGGSIKGTTVIWGDYGLRMIDHQRRISAKSFKMAEDTIKVRLRGEQFRLYKRKCCNIGVYVSGNEIRMGKGKGSFDHWAARVAVSQVIFEIKGQIHEQVVRDAFRLAGNKLPGQYEFVKKGDPPVVGITKLEGVTMEELKRPRRKIAPMGLLQASSPTAITEAGSTSEASKPGS